MKLQDIGGDERWHSSATNSSFQTFKRYSINSVDWSIATLFLIANQDY